MTDATLRPLLTWRSIVASAAGPKSPVTRHVLLTLSLHMNEKGESCFPSTKTLANETGLSERAVCTHLALAAEEGWIDRQLVGYRGQKWARMEYSPTIPNGQEKPVDNLKKGTERHSVPLPKALNVTTKGTERHDKKALNDVQCSSSLNSSISKPCKPSTPPKAARFDPMAMICPEGVDQKAWEEWIAYRRKRKLSTTETTARKQMAFLADCAAKGQKSGMIIEASIQNGWQGLFELKGGSHATDRTAIIDAFTGRNKPRQMHDIN